MEFEIINNTQENIELFLKITEKCSEEVFKTHQKNSEITIFIETKEAIQNINRTYRKKDYPTDVISFAYDDVEDNINYGELEVQHYLGDIYICYDLVVKQAREYDHSLEREYAFLLVHGFLHLLGYDHETKEDEMKMFSLQNDILEKLQYRRIK